MVSLKESTIKQLKQKAKAAREDLFFKGREFELDFEVEMQDGFGSSSFLVLSFDANSELDDAILFGIHFYTELEIEQDYNIDTDEAKELILSRVSKGEIKS